MSFNCSGSLKAGGLYVRPDCLSGYKLLHLQTIFLQVYNMSCSINSEQDVGISLNKVFLLIWLTLEKKLNN